MPSERMTFMRIAHTRIDQELRWRFARQGERSMTGGAGCRCPRAAIA